MIRAALLTVWLLAFMPQRSNAAGQDVQFTTAVSAPAFVAALDAIKANSKDTSVRLSDVSGSFVRLVDGRPQQLLVQLGGGWCGSLGCSVTLYEQGVLGWMPVNEWIVGSVGVLPSKSSAGWHDLVLNHERVWKHIGEQYILTDGRLRNGLSGARQ